MASKYKRVFTPEEIQRIKNLPKFKDVPTPEEIQRNSKNLTKRVKNAIKKSKDTLRDSKLVIESIRKKQSNNKYREIKDCHKMLRHKRLRKRWRPAAS